MNVDFFSFSYAERELRLEWKSLLSQAIEEGTFIGGSHVREFEHAWASFTHSKYAVGVSNGFDGLTLALRALGIGLGDYVAVPAHTFIATWNAVISVGAVPIGIDVDDDGLMELNQLCSVVKTLRAVIPVHMHGFAVNMKELFQICNDSSLDFPIRIIEDASQAHGAENIDGSKLGTYSDIVVYSLYPTKNLGALGDAGIITTDSKDLAESIVSLSNYGNDQNNKYLHKSLGYNNRLDSIQAIVLKKNLEMLDMWNKKRQYLSAIYIRELSGSFKILQESSVNSVRHHFCILNPERDELRLFLKANGIKTEIHYPNVAGIEASSFLNRIEKFEKAESISRTTLSLPLSQWHTERQIDFVIAKLKQWSSR